MKKQEPYFSIHDPLTPRVGGFGKKGRYLAFTLMVIVAIVLARGFFAQPEKNPATNETIQTAETTTPLNLTLSPAQYVATLPVLPLKQVPPPPPAPEKIDNRANFMIENTAADEARIKSASLVYSIKDNPADKTLNNSGNDNNNAFLQQAANNPVITVSAKQESNMNYKILQGKLIIAVLETAINSDLPGMVRAVVSKDIYGDTGKVVLLPKGTRLIGQYNSNVAIGQTRVMIAWTRAITPNHVDIALGSPSSDTLGQTGMGGDVDTHFWQVFGTSALLSVLGVAGSAVNTGNSGQIGVLGNPYQTAVVQGVMNTSNNVLQTRINMQPTLHIPQGSAIQVFVARDLDFSNLGYMR